MNFVSNTCVLRFPSITELDSHGDSHRGSPTYLTSNYKILQLMLNLTIQMIYVKHYYSDQHINHRLKKFIVNRGMPSLSWLIYTTFRTCRCSYEFPNVSHRQGNMHGEYMQSVKKQGSLATLHCADKGLCYLNTVHLSINGLLKNTYRT